MKALLTALIKAQGEFEAVTKDRENPAFKSKYATLGSVNEAVDPALRKYGLLVLQDARTEWVEGRCLVIVGTALWHAESGENVSHSLALIPAKTDPQGIGSAISYGRRYGKMTLLGLSAEDDDGSAASSGKPVTGQAQGKPTQQMKAAPQHKTEPERKPEPTMTGNQNGANAVAVAGPLQGRALLEKHIRDGQSNSSVLSPAIWQTWRAPADAFAWAMEQGACANEFEAKNSLKKIVDGQFGGRLTSGNMAQVFEAFHAHQIDKIAQRNGANGEPPATPGLEDDVPFGMGDNAPAPTIHGAE